MLYEVITLSDPNMAPRSKATQFAKGHEQGTVIGISDYFRRNRGAALEWINVTQGTDGRAGTGSFDNKADYAVYFAIDTYWSE